MDPGERDWQETQRRKLETREWTYSGSSTSHPSESFAESCPRTAPAPASIDDVVAAQSARARANAQSLMHQVNQVDGKALSFWRGSKWKVTTVPAFYRTIVVDFLKRVPPDHYQSGWVLPDDVYYGPSIKIEALLPRDWVTATRFAWWDVSGRRRNHRAVALLDERAERVRYVHVPLEEVSNPDARTPSYHFIVFFDDGLRCVSDDSADHRFKTPDTVTAHIANYLARVSAAGGAKRARQ